MESRRQLVGPVGSSSLPHDYLELVQDVFATNFDAGLKAFAKISPNPSFHASGAVFLNEIVLGISLISEGRLAATTVWSSTDFDPKANSPTVQELLAACVDAIGPFFEEYLNADDPKKLELLTEESLSSFDKIPFEWKAVEIGKFKIYLKISKANPRLDKLAEDWLEKNDPEHQARLEEEQKEIAELFVTGPKKNQIH